MLTNWTTNSKMQSLLKDDLSNPYAETLKLNSQKLKALFSPSFKKVRDCIIITEKEIDRLEMTFDNAIKMYMDKTGYEASNTETRINSYFDNDISVITGTQIALIVTEIWALKLKQMEPESKFCIIMCSDEESVEIRFHKIRDKESRWLSENLEGYQDGAVGYVEI